ncbi:hypothetical protein J6O48_02790, partial [bacterium]|nr:hypothetical protein [bacterium]
MRKYIQKFIFSIFVLIFFVSTGTTFAEDVSTYSALLNALSDYNISTINFLNSISGSGDLGSQQVSTLTLNGGNFSLTGSNNNGFSLSSGQMLNINNFSNWTGYSTAITNNGGSVFVTNSTISSNIANSLGTMNFSGADIISGAITNSGTLNLNSNSSGITISGNISGSSGIINVNSSASGKVKISSSVTGNRVNVLGGTFEFSQNTFADNTSPLNIANGNINLANNAGESFSIKNLVSNAAAKYSIDKDDKFTVGSGSSGVITLVNITNLPSSLFNDLLVLDILHRENSSDNIVLALDQNLINSYNHEWVVTDYPNNPSNPTEYVIYDDSFLGLTSIGLNNTKDSVMIGTFRKDSTLQRTNVFTSTGVKRSYNFRSAKRVKEEVNLGNTGAGTFNVNGANSNASQSIIDLSGTSGPYSGFNLVDTSNTTALTINNLTIEGGSTALTLNSSKASAVLNNVILSGNNSAIVNTNGTVTLNNVTVSAGTSSTVKNDVINASSMSLNSVTINSSLSNSGTLTSTGATTIANVTNSGTLKLNSSSDKITNKLTNTNVVSTSGKTEINNLENTKTITFSGDDSVTGTLQNSGASAKITTNGSKVTLNNVTNTGEITLGSTENILKGLVDGSAGKLNLTTKTTLTGEISASQVVNLTGNLDITSGTLTLNSGDSWNSTIAQTGGTLNYNGLTSNGILQATGGNLNINSGTLTIGNTSKITSAVKTTLGNATLSVSGGEVSLNSGDSWASNGAISLSSGTLNYDNLTSNGILQAAGGNLNLNSGSLTLASGSSIADGVKLTIGASSTLSLNGGTLNINNNDTLNSSIQAVSGNLNISNRTITSDTINISSSDNNQVNTRIIGSVIDFTSASKTATPHYLGVLNISTDSNVKIDISSDNQSVDTIYAGTGSTGTIQISEINGLVLSKTKLQEYVDNPLSLRVLYRGSNSDNIKLALSSALSTPISKTVDEYYNSSTQTYRVQKGDVIGYVALGLNNTFDTIISVAGIYDELAMTNQFTPTSASPQKDRYFIVPNNDTYTAKANTGTTGTVGTMYLQGNNSIVDYVGSYSGFVVPSAAKLNISGITFKNAKSSTSGSFISNSGQVTQLNASFVDNIATVSNRSIYGGAVYNTGTISSIVGDFSGNSAVSNQFEGSGGAIYNTGTINYISGSFYNNYAQGGTGAYGGAIYSSTPITLLANNANYTISGNYIQVGGGSKVYQAIYMSAVSASLTMQMNNNGSWTLNDNIDGVVGYNVYINSSDGTGKLNLYGQINNAIVTTENVTINLAGDSAYNTYSFNTLNLRNNSNFILDINYSTKAHDTINISAQNSQSTGTLIIKDIVGITAADITSDEVIIKVLNQPNSSSIQIAIADSLKARLSRPIGIDERFDPTTQSYVVHSTDYFGTVGIDVRGKDSIYFGWLAPEDALAVTNQFNTNKNKYFILDAVGDTNKFTTIANTGTTLGTMYVQGTVDSQGNTSVIDYVRRYKGFTVNSGANLSISNVTIQNILSSTAGAAIDNNGNLSLNNVIFKTNVINGGEALFGGLIRNNTGSTVDTFKVKFLSNQINSNGYNVYGGIIYNVINLGEMDITASNNVISTNVDNGANILGGFLYNTGSISSIKGDFSDNTFSTASKNVNGGIIYNENGTISSITATFTNNLISTSTATDSAKGGAIYNNGTIENLVTTFTSNMTKNFSGIAAGGAVYNTQNGILTTIDSDFYGNYSYVNNTQNKSYGGAIYNEGRITTIQDGVFEDNYSYSNASLAYGGGIENRGTITTISNVIFRHNYTESTTLGGESAGGAIDNRMLINTISADFDRNYAKSISHATGGAILNIAEQGSSASGTIFNITGSFSNNYTESTAQDANGGAITNSGTINSLVADFTNNYSKAYQNAYGGALYNTGTISTIKGSFKDNYAIGQNVAGGAIYTTTTLNFVANSATDIYEISGNYIATSETADKVYQAIFVAAPSLNINFNLTKGGKYTVMDNIASSGNMTYNVYFNSSDKTGTMIFKGEIQNGRGRLNGATLTFGENTFAHSSSRLYATSGAINAVDDLTSEYKVTFLQSNEAVKYSIDLDFDNTKADMFKVGRSSTGVITIDNINVLGELPEPQEGYEKLFQIIKYTNTPADKSNTIQLALGDSINSGKLLLVPNMMWHETIDEGYVFRLVNTDYKYDTISYAYQDSTDLLHAMNTFNTSEERHFTARNSYAAYTVKKNTGVMANKSDLYIEGYANGNSFTTINYLYNNHNYSGFELGNGTNLFIYQTRIINALSENGGVIYSNSDSADELSTVTIWSSIFESNTANTNGGAVYGSANSKLLLTDRVYITIDPETQIETKTIEDSNISFKSNAAGASGGAIYNEGELSITAKTVGFNGNSAVQKGGAIYNSNKLTIESPTVSFENNYADIGGSIYNSGSMVFGIEITEKNQTISFINNGKASNGTTYSSMGGAIYNEGDFVNYIKSSLVFTGNYAQSGGAVYSLNTFTINGPSSFSGNYAMGLTAGSGFGGAIFANGSLIFDKNNVENVSYTFNSNYAQKSGGAIYALGNVDVKYGTFDSNIAKDVSGGAIYLSSNTTDSIYKSSFKNNKANQYGGAIFVGTNSSFVGNYVSYTNNSATSGGALYLSTGISANIFDKVDINPSNPSNFGYTLESSFVGTDVSNNKATDYGGAIYVSNNTTLLAGGHAYKSNSAQSGGAIYNLGTLSVPNKTASNRYALSSFNQNSAVSTSNNAYGGAIYNTGTVDTLFGGRYNAAWFNNNYAHSDSAMAKGGAIYNTGTFISTPASTTSYLVNYSVKFSGNYAESVNDVAMGGAIYNSNSMPYIEAYMIGNSARSTNTSAYGGGLYMDTGSTSTRLWIYLRENYVSGKSASDGFSAGGGIFNKGTITTLDLIGGGTTYYNRVNDTRGSAYGGAIYNDGSITTIYAPPASGNWNYFESNAVTGYVNAKGGAIYNANGKSISSIYAYYNYNNANATTGDAFGGAIYNEGTISSINYSAGYEDRGAYNNRAVASNGTARGGFIYNAGSLPSISMGYIGSNYVSGKYAYGGAIYNEGTLTSYSGYQDNWAVGTTDAHGGAIYSTSDINLIANSGYTRKIQGNYTQVGSGSRVYEAIYMANSSSTLSLQARGGALWRISDSINGVAGYKLNISGDSNASVIFRGDSARVVGANTTLQNVSLYLAPNTFADSNDKLTATSGAISLIDNLNTDYTIYNLDSNRNVKYTLDIGSISNHDKIVVKDTSSRGIIHIQNLKFVDDVATSGVYQLLSAKNNNIQLELDSSLHSYTSGIVNPVVYWYEKFTVAHYAMELATTSTTNDSVRITVDDYSKRDTLALLNQTKTTAARHFIFEASSNVYYPFENTGSTDNTYAMYVDGIGSSTINYQGNYSGFVMDKSGASLTFLHTTIRNAATSGSGSAINAISSSNSSTTFGSGAFYDNKADLYGGAVYDINNAYVYINYTTLQGNTAQKGGAVYFATNRNSSLYADYFYRNGAISTGEAYGGAIFNSSTANTISSSYTGLRENYAKGSIARGGALYNTGAFSLHTYNWNIEGNYAIGTSVAEGGAIYTTKDMTISIGSYNGYAMQGNYVSTDNGVTKKSNVIYAGANNITLTISGGNWYSYHIYDDFAGVGTYNVVFNGAEYFYLYNKIPNSNVRIDTAYIIPYYYTSLSRGGLTYTMSGNEQTTFSDSNVTINSGMFLLNSDAQKANYNFKSLVSSASVGYSLNAGTPDSYETIMTGTGSLHNYDTITVGNGSSGNILINTFDFSSGVTEGWYHILRAPNSNIKLSLNSNFNRDLYVLQPVTNFDAVLSDAYIWRLWSAKTTNDTIYIKHQRNVDILTEWNQTLFQENKVFNLVSADTVYTVKQNIGATATTKLPLQSTYNTTSVLGVASGDKRSTINFDATYTGFVLDDISNLTITNVNLINTDTTNSGSIITSSGTVTLNNVGVMNNTVNSTANSLGGAISSTGTITNISGVFSTNRNIASARLGYGGVIYSSGSISNILNSNFTLNSAQSVGSTSYESVGGAIASVGNIGTIASTVEFSQNNATSAYGSAKGGALYSSGTITSLLANFSENKVEGNSNTEASMGGAVYLGNNVQTLNGTYAGNYVTSLRNGGIGGAIYTIATTLNMNATFSSNYIEASGYGLGGAVALMSTASNISNNLTGNFKENKVTSSGNYAMGGAIYMEGNINNITNSIFEANEVLSNGNYARGGAIAMIGTLQNNSKINSLAADFTENISASTSAYSEGGAIYLNPYSVITSLTGNLASNQATSTKSYTYGGAVANYGSLGSIVGEIKDNTSQASGSSSASSAFGGAIYNVGTINTITGDISGNSALSTNSAASGGAIYNTGSNITVSGNLINNRAWGTTAFGGAIYSTKDVTLLADNKELSIQGNNISTSGGTTVLYQAIYMDDNNTSDDYVPTLTINTKNNGSWIISDYISGTNSLYNVRLTSEDKTGKIYLHNDILNAKITIDNANILMANESAIEYTFSQLTVPENSYAYLSIDFNYVASQFDRFRVGSGSSGIVTISELKGLSKSDINKEDKEVRILIRTNESDPIYLQITEELAALYEGIIAPEEYYDAEKNAYVLTPETYTGTIGVRVNDNRDGIILGRVTAHDSLSKVNQMSTDDIDRYFVIDLKEDAVQTYNVISDTGVTGLTGEMFLVGAVDANNNKSIVDYNSNYSGFVVPQNGKLSVKDVVMLNTKGNGVPGAFDNSGVINFDNVDIRSGQSNIVNTVGGVLVNRSGGVIGDGSSGASGLVNVDFINNKTVSVAENLNANGGALYNAGSIDGIIGDFTQNYIYSVASSNGAGIYNMGTINKISSVFDSNYIGSMNPEEPIDNIEAHGAAIYNTNTITNIESTFRNNYAQAKNIATGGAIHNTGTIDSITGDFTYNSTRNAGIYSQGGAVFNKGTISTLTSNFSNNYSSGTGVTQGGAIYADSSSTITNLNGDLIANFVSSVAISEGLPEGDSTDRSSSGGAIYVKQNANIYNISAKNISSNYAQSTYDNAMGGAIANMGNISNVQSSEEGEITEFLNNTATASTKEAYGGAVYNKGTISITAQFNRNSATATNDKAYGGAIYNEEGTLSLQTGSTLSYNSVSGAVYAEGGAISNRGNIDTIVGTTFTSNSAISSNGEAYGGALAIVGDYVVRNIQTTFSGNYTNAVTAYGGAIYAEGNVTSVTSTFTNNYSTGNYAYGGALANFNEITEITDGSSFSNNYAIATYNAFGGALANLNDAKISTLYSNFNSNYVMAENAYGGAIYNTGKITTIYGSFNNNYAEGTAEARGGAVYTTKDLTFVSNGVKNTFTGNYVTTDEGATKTSQVIFVAPDEGSNVTVSFDSTNGGGYTIDDDISGSNSFDLKFISSDDSAEYVLNNHMMFANTEFNGGTYKFNADTFEEAHDSLTVTNGNISLNNGVYTQYNINRLVSVIDAKYNIDVDATYVEGGSLVGRADVFHVGADSLGEIYINNIGTPGQVSSNVFLPIKVIDKIQESDNIKLILNDTITANNFYATVASYARKDSEGQIVDYYVRNVNFIGAIGIFVNNEENDFANSVEYEIDNDSDSIVFSNITKDTLHMVNVSNLSPRIYQLSSPTKVDVTTNLGVTGQGIFSVLGASYAPENNTIDFKQYSGFDLENETELTIRDLTLTNSSDLLKVNNENAKVLLENVHITNNTSAINNILGEVRLSNVNISVLNGSAQNNVLNSGIMNISDSEIYSAVTNSGEMTLSGTNKLYSLSNANLLNISDSITADNIQNSSNIIIGENLTLSAYISGDGTISTNETNSLNLIGTTIVNNAVNISSGDVVFGVNTFKDAGVTTITNGNINLNDSSIKQYNVNKLILNQSFDPSVDIDDSGAVPTYTNVAKFNLDLDFSDKTNPRIDNFIFNNNSTGSIVLYDLAGIVKSQIGTSDYVEFIIINNINGSNVELVLDPVLVDKLQLVYTIENDYYNPSTQTYEVYDDVFLGKTGVMLNNDKTGIIIGYTDKLKNLHETNISELTPRKYSFRTATRVKEEVDLGETGAGVFSVNGSTENAQDSVIDLSGVDTRYSGFNLVNTEKTTDLTINNLTIEGGSTAIALNSDKATAVLNNVILQNNESALINTKGNVTLNNVIVSAGTSATVKNDITNADTMSLNTVTINSVLNNSGSLTTGGTNSIEQLINTNSVSLNGDDKITTLTNSSGTVSVENKTIITTLTNTLGTVTTKGETTITTLTNTGNVTAEGINTITDVSNEGTLTLNGTDDKITNK